MYTRRAGTLQETVLHSFQFQPTNCSFSPTTLNLNFDQLRIRINRPKPTAGLHSCLHSCRHSIITLFLADIPLHKNAPRHTGFYV